SALPVQALIKPCDCGMLSMADCSQHFKATRVPFRTSNSPQISGVLLPQAPTRPPASGKSSRLTTSNASCRSSKRKISSRPKECYRSSACFPHARQRLPTRLTTSPPRSPAYRDSRSRSNQAEHLVRRRSLLCRLQSTARNHARLDQTAPALAAKSDLKPSP